MRRYDYTFLYLQMVSTWLEEEDITLPKKMSVQFMFNLKNVAHSKHILTNSFDNKYSDDILVVNNNHLFHEIYTKEPISKTNIINDSCHFMDLDINTLS